jgi:hypothetical protein
METSDAYIRVEYTHLLNVKHRKKISDQSVKQSMPLKVEFQCNREGYLDAEGVVSDLLTPDLHLWIYALAFIAYFMLWFKQKHCHPMPEGCRSFYNIRCKKID